MFNDFFYFVVQVYKLKNMGFKSDPSKNIGKNQFDVMCSTFATLCKFEDAAHHKPHGKHALGVTMLSNLSVSEQKKLKVSRHASMKNHACYQKITSENLEKKHKAMNLSLCTESSSKDSVEIPELGVSTESTPKQKH